MVRSPLSFLLVLTLAVARASGQAGHAAAAAGGSEAALQQLFLAPVPFPQPLGTWQFTGGASFARDADGERAGAFGAVQYGIAPAAHVYAGVPGTLVNPDLGPQQEGVGDVQLGGLYNFVGSDALLVSGNFQVTLPTGGGGIGAGETVYQPSLLLSTHAGRANYYLALGGSLSGEERSFVYDAAVTYPFRRFGIVLELSGSVGDFDATYLVPGAFWQASDKVLVGVGLPVGVGGRAAEVQAILTVIYSP
jgi:hypothetical protein